MVADTFRNTDLMLGKRVDLGDGRGAFLPGVVSVDENGNPVPSGGSGSGSSSLPTGTDRSGSITTGGQSQQIAAANPSRKVLTGQNLSTGDLWINDLGVDAGPQAPSKRVPAGATFRASYQNKVSVWGATTGQAYQADEG